ncbi:MAG: preprotein translocase subunit SecE [Candidatus Omnitrophica bacterium]|nr:preprotein translocase subunit SecE [Candidatus Omnitrophota bacterium]
MRISVLKEKVRLYLNDVRLELSKVSWPTRQQLKLTTIIVIVFMIVAGVYIGLIDVIFSKVISLIIR